VGRRFIGIDVGAETLKLVELAEDAGELRWVRRELREHHKEPARALPELLAQIDWSGVDGATICGRLGRSFALDRIPEKQARVAGYRHLYPDGGPATLVAIGNHGFSVLEIREGSLEVFRENSRCSQGTGNFLRQLVERFGLTIEAASELCAEVEDPAPLSGRCPVILKTDMTHLANQGQSQPRILAGLYDAVCENVQVLIKPQLSPPRTLLVGGVVRAQRIRDNFRGFLARNGMELVETGEDESLFLDALGCARIAAGAKVARALPALDQIVLPAEVDELEAVPALAASLDSITRMVAPAAPCFREKEAPSELGEPLQTVFGLDIGSTGSKAVAIDVRDREVVWQGYRGTDGDPVAAARALVEEFATSAWSDPPLLAIGVTGSGREIVGSLLANCYGPDSVFILNEIAAHAEGALYFEPRVDTIFEIGGQDAKYIRLSEGRVVDAAMNEACSAGTGSFIEEQGRQFSGIENVIQLGEEALASDSGVSLGQHCSVFMAEVIDEASAAGVPRQRIIAGIYDSIVQNYLNRVKGTRSVGQVVFCQGMPFSADALAAAAARQTGAEIVVPPNPGTIGALGIALLTHKERVAGKLNGSRPSPVELERFLGARVLKKDQFVCKSTSGCGEPGNKCRIDRITTSVERKKQRFTWGGGCSLYDKGTGREKLPDLTPDPFREREALVTSIIEGLGTQRGTKTIALTDEFLLKGHFPFFATFFDELGFEVIVHRGAGQRVLKRGIEGANVPFCAPMQQYHGLVDTMAEGDPDYLFLPMLLTLAKVGDELNSTVCPIVQGSADMLKWDLKEGLAGIEVLSPVLDLREGGLRATEVIRACHELADGLGAGDRWQRAFESGLEVQDLFVRRCFELGSEALDACEAGGIVPVVVLGRPYTIYNTVLNSNVPAILREQGALAIPVDCYPVDDSVPVFNDMFWAQGQRNLRAAHQIRRDPGVYSLWCSNYSCGPDSFNLHFYAYAMAGKPYAVIETDGHSGDAGTRTRVEAYLYCVREDRRRLASGAGSTQPPAELKRIEEQKQNLSAIEAGGQRVLIPRMGPSTEALAACLRGYGVPAEALPEPDREDLRLGRRHTSGKECVPMTITMGSLLKRLEQEEDPDTLFSFLMPTGRGPCRFGAYHTLHKIVLERLGFTDRVGLWSPEDSGYFEDTSAGLEILLFSGIIASDLLLEAYNHVVVSERRPGVAQEIYQRHFETLIRHLEEAARGNLGVTRGIAEVTTGRFYGCADLLRRATQELASVMTPGDHPTVLVVGEIYVRCDPFANDFAVRRLQERGMRVRFAPFHEWLDYQDFINDLLGVTEGLSARVSTLIQRRIQRRSYQIVSDALGWAPAPTAEQSLEASAAYVRHQLEGEAGLTIGGPIHEWRAGLIDGVLSLGPLECMPSKIAESQFFHVAEQEGLFSATLALNGEPTDPEALDNFVYEVQTRFERRCAGARPRPPANETPAPTKLETLRRLVASARVADLRGLRPDIGIWRRSEDGAADQATK